MRRPRRWLPPLFILLTLLLVAAGAAMPFAVSYMQDARQTGTETRPFDSFSLTLQQKSDLGQTLRAIARNYHMVIEDEPAQMENAVLTEELALEAAEAVLVELEKHDLLYKEIREQFLDPSVRAQTVIPERIEDANAAVLPGPDDGKVASAAVGTVTWSEEDGIPTWAVSCGKPYHFFIWLDDASGKAIQLSFPSYAAVDKDRTFLEEKWRRFVEDYYGVEAALSDHGWLDGIAQYTFSLTLGEDEEACRLNLNLYPDGYASIHPW